MKYCLRRGILKLLPCWLIRSNYIGNLIKITRERFKCWSGKRKMLKIEISSPGINLSKSNTYLCFHSGNLESVVDHC